jgi:hypothetical protein
MRIAGAVALCVVAVLSAGAAISSAANGGNSANAKLCQAGGWSTLVRSEDSSPFFNEGACVSYAARGGTLVPKGPSQLLCDQISGTFSTNPATNMDPNPVRDGYVFAWSCNGGLLPVLPLMRALWFSCVSNFDHPDAMSGYFWWTSTPALVFYFTCYRKT